jgi:hypothetical protein
MNDYGSITIDNRNLLDDLLGLAGEHQNELNDIYHQQQQYELLDNQLNNNYNQQPFHLQQQPFQLNVKQQNFQLNQQQPIALPRNNNNNQTNNNNFNLQGGLQKVYLESPTFDKEEDDIYRLEIKIEFFKTDL